MELLHKTKAEEWKQVHKDLTIKAEEKLSRVQKELENKAESEKQALQKQFQLREAEMTCLQEQQSARIVELEKSLKEQQNIVQQLEDSLLTAQTTLAHYDKELNSIKSLRAQELENNKQELHAKLKNAQNRYVINVQGPQIQKAHRDDFSFGLLKMVSFFVPARFWNSF